MNLDTPVTSLAGVGPWVAECLHRLGIKNVKDLVFYFPARYQNFSQASNISGLQPGETATVKGQIISMQNIYTRNGKKIQKAVLSDGIGEIGITWFNQTYLAKTLLPGTWVSLSGKVGKFGRKVSLVAPQYEKIASLSQGETIHTGRLVPVYPETTGLSSKWIRTKISQILPRVKDEIEEYLPANALVKYKLTSLTQAINAIHFPKNNEEGNSAQHRLAFDEFFRLQINSLYRKNLWTKKRRSQPLTIKSEKVKQLIGALPYKLTNAQKLSAREILQDMTRTTPMNRLLQGDVGSGKTVVAAIAAYVTHLNNLKTVIMTPTQILANQHFLTLKKIFDPLGLTIALCTQKTKHDTSSAHIIVGTQALLQKGLTLENIGLVVIDEQHRFGVAQRAKLIGETKALSPHLLTMTATPIPRTVALTIYGDLDLSIIDEMPTGRQKVKTWVVPPKKRTGAYNWIRERVKDTDEQAFIVCPLIEQSEKESMQSVKAASAEFTRLERDIFPDLRLGLLHGRQKTGEKGKVMELFKKGNLDILVATPVVEVGIDIPRATIMLIEASERFGLAQLHQLRGRVGRGEKQSYCLLFTESFQALPRLKSLETIHSGSKLAEIDLKLRGPGEIYGLSQHGYPELKIANFSQTEVLHDASELARELISKIDSLPKIKKLIETNPVSPN